MENALSKTPDPKLTYLYQFEALFREKCREANIQAGKWQQGMWTNAHMHHGQGNGVEEGVKQWFKHVVKQKQ